MVSYLGFSIVCPISYPFFHNRLIFGHPVFSSNQFAQYKDLTCYVVLPFSVN